MESSLSPQVSQGQCPGFALTRSIKSLDRAHAACSRTPPGSKRVTPQAHPKTNRRPWFRRQLTRFDASTVEDSRPSLILPTDTSSRGWPRQRHARKRCNVKRAVWFWQAESRNDYGLASCDALRRRCLTAGILRLLSAVPYDTFTARGDTFPAGAQEPKRTPRCQPFRGASRSPTTTSRSVPCSIGRLAISLDFERGPPDHRCPEVSSTDAIIW